MAVTDAPTVTLDGVTLASAWSHTQRIALNGLAITWGRETHLDQAEPATLQLEVLDTDGQIASSAALIGQRVTVVRADGRTIFRGRVDDFIIDHIEMNDPATNRTRRVWRYKIAASDTLSDLAKTRPPGPGNEPSGVAALGPDYWYITPPSVRIDDIETAADGMVSSIEWNDPYPLGYAYPFVRWRSRGEDFTLLNNIEGVYNIIPLGYVRHDPHTNAITIGKPAATDGVELTWDGDTLDVTLPAGGHTIPARDVAMPDGYRVGSGKEDAIDVVQIVSERLGVGIDARNTKGITTEAHTDHYAPGSLGVREYRRATELLYSLDSGEIVTFRWPFPLEYVTSEYGYRGTGFHEGIDFSGGPAVSGEPIPAAGGGTVVTNVTLHAGWGNYIVIDHGDVDGKNLKTLYAHLIEPSTLAVGTPVAMGETIGYVGNTGNSYGAHLHLETWVDGNHINPRNFMDQYGATPNNPDEGLWHIAAAEDTAELLNQLNGKVALPRVRLDWRNFTYANAIGTTFIDGTSKDTVVYFPGSVFAPIIDAATEHQIIGGRLVYYRGWTLDATLAPAIRNRDGLTIDQLVTIDAPLISDFADDLLLADIGNVTKGVTA